MLQLYNYVIWFKVCRKARNKFKQSANSLLILAGAYTYYKVIGKAFTMRKLLGFITFFNGNKIKFYLSKLMLQGYIIESGKSYGYPTYIVSDLGNDVMNELSLSYERELSLFCSMYNIIL